MTFGPQEGPNGYAVYFGDTGANVYALDAATGHELWSHKLDEHLHARITGSPTLYQRPATRFQVTHHAKVSTVGAGAAVAIPVAVYLL